MFKLKVSKVPGLAGAFIINRKEKAWVVRQRTRACVRRAKKTVREVRGARRGLGGRSPATGPMRGF